MGLEKETQAIQEDFTKRKDAIDVARKIQLSNVKNAARLSVLRARNDALSTLFATARSRLAGLGKGPKYEGLFRDLLLQALIKLSEPKVNVNVRKADLALAKKVIPGVVESYQTKTRSQVVVNLDEKRLPPSPEEAGENAPSCCGGVVVVSARK